MNTKDYHNYVIKFSFICCRPTHKVYNLNSLVFNLFYHFEICHFQDPVDPVEACHGLRGIITQYKIRFQSGNTDNVKIARCTAGRCNHTFKPPSNPPASYDNVSVAAENVVGMGPSRTCTAQAISEWQCYYVLVD